MYLFCSLIAILIFCVIIVYLFKSDRIHDLSIKIGNFEITILRHKE